MQGNQPGFRTRTLWVLGLICVLTALTVHDRGLASDDAAPAADDQAAAGSDSDEANAKQEELERVMAAFRALRDSEEPDRMALRTLRNRCERFREQFVSDDTPRAPRSRVHAALAWTVLQLGDYGALAELAVEQLQDDDLTFVAYTYIWSLYAEPLIDQGRRDEVAELIEAIESRARQAEEAEESDVARTLWRQADSLRWRSARAFGDYALVAGEEAPTFELAVLDADEPVTLEQLRGGFVLLHFCNATMPSLMFAEEFLAPLHNALDDEQFRVVTVRGYNFGIQMREHVDRERLREPFAWLTLYDEVDRSTSWNMRAVYDLEEFPTLTMIDPQGRLVAHGSPSDVLPVAHAIRDALQLGTPENDRE